MIKWSEYLDVWGSVKRSARTTIHKDGEGTYPSDSWKKTILLAEHSPIRRIMFGWKWSGMKSWVSVHFVRHKHGIEHWVSTQRTDRTGIDRDASRQDAPVDHECLANAQALIFISRRRLCSQAAKETREAWKEVKQQVAERDPVLASVMVPECIYRGFCPEFKGCGFVDTEEYQRKLAEYRRK
ncbi:MAG: thymidylate synthase ThyX [Clostridia bacterium]|nr:thymidylate synthase ThyX [Clostridia bacterium]MBQ9212225.1 thymidylate synthase ThyX [Clostridia bacterium]